ncbi:MAG: M3 family oligoendopeptidase, partial [Oscillospiraceae bacterium]|nr:M3 family oligoendopeptidase [Oscillospiraceae bacterium]
MENFSFDKIEYVRPDIDKAEENCKEYTARIRAAKSYDEVKEVILESDKSGEDMHTMIVVAHIRNTLNTTDKFYEDEMAFLHQRLPVAQATFTEFSKAIAECPFTAEIDADFGPEYLTKIRRELDSFKPELIPYLQEESMLTTEYQKLMATANIEFDGKTLNLYGIQSYFGNPDREIRK